MQWLGRALKCGAALGLVVAVLIPAAAVAADACDGLTPTILGTPATEAVNTDICAEATIGNLPPGT